MNPDTRKRMEQSFMFAQAMLVRKDASLSALSKDDVAQMSDDELRRITVAVGNALDDENSPKKNKKKEQSSVVSVGHNLRMTKEFAQTEEGKRFIKEWQEQVRAFLLRRREKESVAQSSSAQSGSAEPSSAQSSSTNAAPKIGRCGCKHR